MDPRLSFFLPFRLRKCELVCQHEICAGVPDYRICVAAGRLYMVIFIGGLQEVPAELYEAAKVDGAGAGRG